LFYQGILQIVCSIAKDILNLSYNLYLMIRKGFAELPLHGGKCPPWLFKRMVELSRGISKVLIEEKGVNCFLERMSDSFWFQSLGCVLGYDFHSSGLTTTVGGALKEALNKEDLGVLIAGGKGKVARKTPQEVVKLGESIQMGQTEIDNLIYSSKLAAKVDNSVLQDGYNLYHHIIIFTEGGRWAVIQQGMDLTSKSARRYHWLSEHVKSFVKDPHDSVISSLKRAKVLDMSSQKSEDAQKTSIDLVNGGIEHLRNDWEELKRPAYQKSLDEWSGIQRRVDRQNLDFLQMPQKVNWAAIKELYDFQPKDYEELVSTKGIGPSTIRALALVSDLIYGSKPSWKDPVKFAFTVGGKDGVPYPVDRKAMSETTAILEEGIEASKVGNREKLIALEKLRQIIPVE
jgi:hypothetical protein